MFEVYQSVGNITVEGNRFSDLCTRIPVADIFKKRRKRRRRNAIDEDGTEYTDDDDYYDIWDDEYYNEDNDDDELLVTKVDRINFSKYGSRDVTNVTDTLARIPKSIYCDLVTT